MSLLDNQGFWTAAAALITTGGSVYVARRNRPKENPPDRPTAQDKR